MEVRDDEWDIAVIGKEGVLVWARVGTYVISHGMSTVAVQRGLPRLQIWQKYKKFSLSYGKYVKALVNTVRHL
jgi:hypothetical protein